MRTVKRGKGILWYLVRAKSLWRGFPESVKRFGLRFLPRDDYIRLAKQIEDPNVDAEEVSTYPAKVDFTIGIIKDFLHFYSRYITACRDMGVPYKLLDISGPDWMDVVRDSGCDAFVLWRPVYSTVWKHMYDERLKIIVEKLGKIIYPSYDELWLFVSKRRMYYWLEAAKIPHPKTWVFYDIQDALQFAKETELPIVFKSDSGSGGGGIKFFRNRSSLLRFVKRCFRKGILRTGADPRDREWGFVLFQEYLRDAAEWRMVRIGESYFGYEKLKEGDFHSGSHLWRYLRPPSELLNLTREVTNKGKFSCMNLDVFITADGRYLLNELQALFGMFDANEPQCVIDGKAGRMVWDDESNCWRFEEGDFCKNYLCNLRIETLIKLLEKNRMFTAQ